MEVTIAVKDPGFPRRSAKLWTVADLRGGAGDAPPVQNFFIFMQFLGKIGQIIGWRPLPLGLAPPPLENPGSATAGVGANIVFELFF